MTKSHGFWILVAIVFLVVGTVIGFTVQARNREADRRIAKEACEQVNALRRGTVEMAKTIRDGVDLVQSPEDRALIIENYDRALTLVEKADCNP